MGHAIRQSMHWKSPHISIITGAEGFPMQNTRKSNGHVSKEGHNRMMSQFEILRQKSRSYPSCNRHNGQEQGERSTEQPSRGLREQRTGSSDASLRRVKIELDFTLTTVSLWLFPQNSSKVEVLIYISFMVQHKGGLPAHKSARCPKIVPKIPSFSACNPCSWLAFPA